MIRDKMLASYRLPKFKNEVLIIVSILFTLMDDGGLLLFVKGQSSNPFRVERSSLPGPTYPIAGLPLFDEHTNGLLILRHKFVLRFQLRCILLGAPCDVIGRWLKPRVEKIMVENKCEACTPTQERLVTLWMDAFVQRFPEFWRAAMAKYVENMGIPLPPDEKNRMVRMLGTYP